MLRPWIVSTVLLASFYQFVVGIRPAFELWVGSAVFCLLVVALWRAVASRRKSVA